MKEVARYTAVILLTLAAVFLAWQFRVVLLLIVVSLIVAAVVRPFIIYLVRLKMPATVAQIIIYTLGLTAIALAVGVFIRPLAVEVGQLTNWLIVEHERVYLLWLFSDEPWRVSVAEQLPNPDELYTALFGNDGELFLTATFGFVQGAATVVGGFLFALVLSIYWSVDQARFERFWLSFLSVENRVRARNGWRKMEQEIGRFVRIETMLSLLCMVLLGVGYWLLKMQFPILLALIGGLAWFLPLIGIFVIGIPVFLLGLQISPALAFAGSGFTLFVFSLLTFYLEPKLQGRSRFSYITLILVMIPLVTSFGLLGFVIAPPLAITIQLVFSGLMRYRASGREETAVQLAQIERRFDELRENSKDDEDIIHPPEIENILQRLQALIQKSKVVYSEN